MQHLLNFQARISNFRLSLLAPGFAVFAFFSLSLAHAWNTPVTASSGNKYSKYTWTGADFATNLNWNNPSNWCGAYVDGACRPPATAPAATDSVVFNDICGANCNVTVDANVTVNSITLDASYTGTISQGNFNVTANGTNGFAFLQAGGTWTAAGGSGTLTLGVGAVAQKIYFTGGNFIGGSGTVQMGNFQPADIIYLTGGNFTAPTGTLLLRGAVDMRGLASFNHNNGLVEIYTGTSSTVGGHFFTGTSAVFNNVKLYAPTTSLISMNNTTMTVDGNATLCGAAVSTVTYNSGVIELRQGNLIRCAALFVGTAIAKFTGTGLQTIDTTAATNTGTIGIAVEQTAVAASVRFIGTSIELDGGFSTAGNMGTIDHNNVAFTFTEPSTYNNNPYDTGSYVTFPSLTINGNAIRLYFGTVKTGNLTISSVGGSANVSNFGSIEVTGNVNFGAAGASLQHVATLKMNGVGNQSIDCTGTTTCGLPSLEINKTGGTLSFVGTPALFANFTYTQGSVTVPTDFQLGYGIQTANKTITSNGAFVFNNLIYGSTSSSGHTLSAGIGDPIKVSGNLVFSNTNGADLRLINTLEVAGNVSCNAGASGLTTTTNAIVKLTGVNQTLDFSACTTTPTTNSNVGFMGNFPNLEINSSGNVTSSGNFRVIHYTQNSGTVDFTASKVRMYPSNGTITPGSTEFGDVEIDGISANLTGTMKVNGNLSFITNIAGRSINGGTVDVYGNLSLTNASHSGTATIRMLGTSNATISRSSTNIPTGLFTIAKTGGAKVTLASNFSWGAGQSVSITNGQLDVSSFTGTISGGGTLTLAATTTVKLSTGAMSVGGSNLTPGAYSGGNIIP